MQCQRVALQRQMKPKKSIFSPSEREFLCVDKEAHSIAFLAVKDRDAFCSPQFFHLLSTSLSDLLQLNVSLLQACQQVVPVEHGRDLVLLLLLPSDPHRHLLLSALVPPPILLLIHLNFFLLLLFLIFSFVVTSVGSSSMEWRGRGVVISETERKLSEWSP